MCYSRIHGTNDTHDFGTNSINLWNPSQHRQEVLPGSWQSWSQWMEKALLSAGSHFGFGGSRYPLQQEYDPDHAPDQEKKCLITSYQEQ